MTPLSPKRRSELRAEAHKLSPVVIIGDKGLTDEVIAEIDRSLKAHELIKVRAATDERDARGVWIETICDRLQAHPVQQIGKVFVIYRENPGEEKKQAKLDPGPSSRGRAARDDAVPRNGGRVDAMQRNGGRGEGSEGARTRRLARSASAFGDTRDAPKAKRPPRGGGASVDTRGAPKAKRPPRGGSASVDARGVPKSKRPPRSGSADGNTRGAPKSKRPPRGGSASEDDARSGVKRTSRQRSPAPSPRPASEPRRRRPRTSR